MNTEQIALLKSLLQYSAKSNVGADDTPKNDFQDLLARKKSGAANNADPQEMNGKTEAPQSSGEPAEELQETNGADEVAAAQQLAAALAVQQFIVPAAVEEQPADGGVPVVADLQQAAVVPTVTAKGADVQQAASDVQQAASDVQNILQQPAEETASEMPRQVLQAVENGQIPKADPSVRRQGEPTAQLSTTAKADGEGVFRQSVAEDTQKPVQVAVAQAEQPVFQDVENIPVKVADAAQTVDTTSADMDARIADTVQAELKNTGDKVEIQLKPEHLGKITIELTQTAGGIGLLIHADNAKTTSLLAQHAGNLGALLEDRTGQHVQVQVPQQEQQQPQYDGHNRQQQEQHQNKRAQEQTMSQDEQDSFLGQLRLGLYQMETV